MDHALRTISYIADIGDLLVVMARRGPVTTSPATSGTSLAPHINQTKICCHIFESDEVSHLDLLLRLSLCVNFFSSSMHWLHSFSNLGQSIKNFTAVFHS